MIPQLQQVMNSYIFQQDRAPPHWHRNVRTSLNHIFPLRWIGRNGQDDLVLNTWPSRSLNLTPCDFFLWGYFKDLVYIPPLPNNVDDFKDRIIAAVQSITVATLTKVWCEFNKRLDMVITTRGDHFEHI